MVPCERLLYRALTFSRSARFLSAERRENGAKKRGTRGGGRVKTEHGEKRLFSVRRKHQMTRTALGVYQRHTPNTVTAYSAVMRAQRPSRSLWLIEE